MNRRDLLVRGAGAGSALAFPGWLSAAADPRLKSLAAAVRGPVLARGASGYDAARPIFDSLYDGIHPLAVVQPLDAADVAAAVKWAAKTGVHIVARSGGHSYGGYSTWPAASSSTCRSWRASRSREVTPSSGRAPGSGTSTTVSPRTGSRFPRARARASASAAMHSAAASGSRRGPGGSPPTISSRCRSSPPTARSSSPTRTTTAICSGRAAAAAAATSGS